jgi:transcriptional regulator with XRE-family HTH domain
MLKLENLNMEIYNDNPFAVNDLIILLATKYELTQKDLVEYTGIHKSQMSRFFNKKEVPSKYQLEKLAAPLKVSKETLWVISGDMLPPDKESKIITQLQALEKQLSRLSRPNAIEELDIDIKLTASEKQFIKEYVEFIKFKRRKKSD